MAIRSSGLRSGGPDCGVWCLALARWSGCRCGLVGPIETIFAGIRFNGDDARVCCCASGNIHGVRSEFFFHRRWGLLLALWLHGRSRDEPPRIRDRGYLPMRSEWENVRRSPLKARLMV